MVSFALLVCLFVSYRAAVASAADAAADVVVVAVGVCLQSLLI